MISPDDRDFLLDLARRSIRHGLDYRRALSLDLASCAASLRVSAATFVTLQREGYLRGCIGRLEAERPLAEDVAENAWAAAFRDPRFPPLVEPEFPEIDIHISVLTPPQRIQASTEQDLLDQLRPGCDGLIIAAGGQRATFLPSVWDSLPDRRQFLHELKRKAGFPADFWSSGLEAFRYETLTFGESD